MSQIYKYSMNFIWQIDLNPKLGFRLTKHIESSMDLNGCLVSFYINHSLPHVRVCFEKQAAWSGWNDICIQFIGELNRNVEEFFASNDAPFRLVSYECKVG